MSANSLKKLAIKLPLQKGGNHDLIRKLVVAGFLDTPKTTDEIITEIRQRVGKRLKSNVMQTYMKKFMENGIVRSFRDKQHRGNLWALANADKVASSQNAAAVFSLPVHPLLQVTKTKILFLAANPTDSNPLALDKESREIEQKIRASDHRDAFELITKWGVRTGDLLQYLNQHRAHVIHFSGHGSPTEELILADTNDQSKPVSKAALKQLFTTLKDNIRVVVLNACFSRPQAEAITEVIDCAIGMNKAIGDKAAITFAAAFYQALGFGRSVKEAFDSGKTALMLDGIPEENTPQLLVRKGIDANAIFLIKATV